MIRDRSRETIYEERKSESNESSYLPSDKSYEFSTSGLAKYSKVGSD